MKKMMLLWVWALFSLAACQKEVTEISLPDLPAKLVVTSFISPHDSLIRVEVSQTITTAEIDSFDIRKSVRDATVILRKGDKAITLPHTTYGEYRIRAADFPIEPGQTYHLQVSTPEGSAVEAFCRVPDVQDNFLVTSIDSSRTDNFKIYEIVLKWKDIPGEKNYYGCSAYLLYPSAEPDVYYDRIVDWQGASPIISDSHFDGDFIISPKGMFTVYMRRAEVKPGEIHALLYTTDSHYYHYHHALYRFDDTNPFAEPAPIYSNIRGGLGVFAAYNLQSQRIKLK